MSAPLRDVLIAEALLAARLGLRRHFQWIRWGLPWVGGFLVGVVTGYNVPRMLAGGLCLWLLFIAITAIYSRWMTRRVDDLMVEILGVDAMYEGLEHYRWPFTVANTLRWLAAGAWMVPGERMRYLKARNPGLPIAE
ncbi:hypothetical protein AB0L70_30570 [Kribbella sp. NPDC051952]|uniref:hypothetical protein n=1 Tax=Kribbella sp. NPDC051952 TaxID=3154851 RepID=UPI00343A1DD9